jgi:predicted nuclease of predicted toxin-antitoxin system
LDANVLIQAWQKYYSPELCPDYWVVLNQLGLEGKVFICQEVYEEIVRTEDDLSTWLKASKIPVKKSSETVIEKLKEIYQTSAHLKLVDNTKNRSLADPWVIAHAMDNNSVVVTKEEKVTQSNSTKVKIPNVCDNLNVRWINDFEFVRELNFSFSCERV